MRALRLKAALVLLIALAEASFPSLNSYIAQCAVTNSTGGTCVRYPQDGLCRALYPNNDWVYVPSGINLSDIEANVRNIIGTALSNRGALDAPGSDWCTVHTLTFTCRSRVYPCVTSSTPGEALPILPCASFCSDYWAACNQSLELYYTQVLKDDYPQSQLPNCAEGGTFSTEWGAMPQPPDTWGGRDVPNWLPTIDGVLGEELFPDGSYNYTFQNGSKQELMCTDANTSLTFADFALPPPLCNPPMQISANGKQCIVSCPFPVFPEATQRSIQWAFIVPALVGVVLCVLTMLDSCFIILEANDYHWRAFAPVGFKWSSTGGGAGGGSSGVAPGSPGAPGSHGASGQRPTSGEHSASHREPKKKGHVRSSTLYALLGAVLGIIYFVIGPLQSLIYGSQLSCALPEMSLNDLTHGLLPDEPTGCRAQRAAPFVLQAIFNLILFSMFRVYQSVNTGFKRMGQQRLMYIDIVLLSYCAGLPVLMLIIAFSIDKLADEAYPASLQLSRQSTYCQVRVSQAAEWLLVFTPFITTGLAVVALSVSIVRTLRDVQQKLGAVVHKTKTASDVALYLFMQRLMGLGLATFIVLIIVIASTSAYTAELAKFAPVFITQFECVTTNIACIDCSIWSNLAAQRQPTPAVLSLQLASMSMIVVLFGTFFFAQTVSRLLKERREGATSQMAHGMPHPGGSALAHSNPLGTRQVVNADSRGDTVVVTTLTEENTT